MRHQHGGLYYKLTTFTVGLSQPSTEEAGGHSLISN